MDFQFSGNNEIIVGRYTRYINRFTSYSYKRGNEVFMLVTKVTVRGALMQMIFCHTYYPRY